MEDSHNHDRQVGADVEITPEMIEAGAMELAKFGWEDELEDGAAAIYRAMALLSPQGEHSAGTRQRESRLGVDKRKR